MLWDAEDRSGFASTAGLLVVLLRVATVLAVAAAAFSAMPALTQRAVIGDGEIARLLHFAELAVVAYVAVVFFRWLATACLNARDVGGDEFEFFPHGAVASFFIPLVNLVLPYRIVKSMYDVSLRARRRGVVYRDGLAVIVSLRRLRMSLRRAVAA